MPSEDSKAQQRVLHIHYVSFHSNEDAGWRAETEADKASSARGRGRISKKRAAAEAPEQNGKKRSKRAPKKNDSPVRPQVLSLIRIQQSSCIFLALPYILSPLTCLAATLSEQAQAESRRMHVLLLKVRN